MVNFTAKTFTFKSKSGEVVPNWKGFYPDLSMLGRHFLVSSQVKNHVVSRQYTIANAMKS